MQMYSIYRFWIFWDVILDFWSADERPYSVSWLFARNCLLKFFFCLKPISSFHTLKKLLSTFLRGTKCKFLQFFNWCVCIYIHTYKKIYICIFFFFYLCRGLSIRNMWTAAGFRHKNTKRKTGTRIIDTHI